MSRSAGPHAAPVNARGERPADVTIYYKVDANPRRWRATGGIRRFPAEFRKTPPGAAHRRQTPDARDVTIATIDARAAQFCHIATVRGRAHAEPPRVHPRDVPSGPGNAESALTTIQACGPDVRACKMS